MSRSVIRAAGARVAALVATTAVLAAACGSGDETGSTGETPDSLTIAIPADVNTIDMSRYQAISDTNVLLNVFDTLTFRGDDGENEPRLAESWDTSEDGLSWTIHVREGVTFQNGDALTAEDVAFSIMRGTDPTVSDTVAQFWSVVTEANVVDDYTVQLTLSEPSPLLMNGPGQRLAVLPKNYFEEVGEDGFLAEPIGAGPYRVEEWRAGDQLTLSAYEDYWGGAPSIADVTFRTITEEASRIAALRSGEVDLVASLGIDQIDQIDSDSALKVETIAGLERQRINIDTFAAPFDDPDVRRAINHAIDVDSIINDLLDGYAERIAGIVVPSEIGFNEDLQAHEYDPDLALELLADAGYPDGFTTDFAVRTGYLKSEEVGQAIAADLSKIGITTNIKYYTSTDYATAAREKTLPPLALTVWTGGGQFNGAQFFDVVARCGTSGQGGYYCDEEADAMITEAYNLWLGDLDAAIDLVQQAEQRFWDNDGNGFLYTTTMIYGLKDGLEWTPTADGNLWVPRMSWSSS
jgi:peptide/nickel transport system substrate-binding protein